MQKLDKNLDIIQGAPFELSYLDGDLNIIQKLDDEPNDVGGLTSAELKETFDRSGNIIKEYINNDLVPNLDPIVQNEKSRCESENERRENEQERVSNEEARASAEQARASAEQARDIAEQARDEAENNRAAAYPSVIQTVTAAKDSAVSAAESAQAAKSALEQSIAANPGSTVIDPTLSVAGAAAEAVAVGQLKQDLDNISEVSLIKIDDETLYNTNAEFEQGQFTSSGDSDNDYWIRTPSNELLDNGFTIYNPDGLRWSIGVYNSNRVFQYYAILGDEPTSDPTIFTDKICKVDYLNDYKYRLRVARTTYVKLSPSHNTLKVYRNYVDKKNISMKSRYRKPVITLSNGIIYHKVGTESGTDGAIYSSDYYRVSNLIRLRKGETIRAYGSGAPSIWMMAEFNSSETFKQGLKVGDGLYHIYEYTADHDMYVKICGQVTYYSTGQNPVITEDNLLNDTIIYYEDDFYSDEIKSSPLYGKTITGMGDSLMHGSITGNDCVWLHHLSLKYNMVEHNLGINGNAFTQGKGSGTPMCERYTQIPESDYIVVEGGANDKNSDAPLGTVSDTTPTTYAGAIYTVINGIRTMYPKAKLVFLTDYNRYPSKYRAYVDIMLQVCARYSVPCFNNFENAGVDVCSDAMKVWQDEGYVLTGTANVHFTPEVYRDVLLPKYEAFLLAQ